MNTLTNNLKDNFTQIPNAIIYDEDLSWKAKGIFLYLASRPSDWQFYVSEIESNATDGNSSLQSGIKELENKGYLKRERKRDDNGQIDGMIWTIMPFKANGAIKAVSRPMENPSDGKSPTTNTNNTNTNNTNTYGDSGFHDVPTLDEVKEYFEDNGYSESLAEQFFNYYDELREERGGRVWKDSNDKTVKSWKHKARHVWFKNNEKEQPSLYKAL